MRYPPRDMSTGPGGLSQRTDRSPQSRLRLRHDDINQGNDR
jgi:hypothetical protein